LHAFSGFTDREFAKLGIGCNHLVPRVVQRCPKIMNSIA
jgi:hypothetical protein